MKTTNEDKIESFYERGRIQDPVLCVSKTERQDDPLAVVVTITDPLW